MSFNEKDLIPDGTMASMFGIASLLATKDKKIADLTRDLEEAKCLLGWMVDDAGVTHELDCPEDDTCECETPARINKLLEGYEPPGGRNL